METLITLDILHKMVRCSAMDVTVDRTREFAPFAPFERDFQHFGDNVVSIVAS